MVGLMVYVRVVYVVIVVFKLKTAYEMRISDWSSDVCSTDLASSRNGPTSSPSGSTSGRYGAPTAAGGAATILRFRNWVIQRCGSPSRSRIMNTNTRI